MSGVRLGTDALFEEQRREQHHLVTVENDHGDETEVIVELAKNPHHPIDPAGLQPFEETTSFHRFRVRVGPRTRESVTIIERWHDSIRFEYTGLSSVHLKKWMKDRFLDEATTRSLASVVEAWNEGEGRGPAGRARGSRARRRVREAVEDLGAARRAQGRRRRREPAPPLREGARGRARSRQRVRDRDEATGRRGGGRQATRDGATAGGRGAQVLRL